MAEKGKHRADVPVDTSTTETPGPLVGAVRLLGALRRRDEPQPAVDLDA